MTQREEARNSRLGKLSLAELIRVPLYQFNNKMFRELWELERLLKIFLPIHLEMFTNSFQSFIKCYFIIISHYFMFGIKYKVSADCLQMFQTRKCRRLFTLASHISVIFEINAFFINNTFISNVRLKLEKKK